MTQLFGFAFSARSLQTSQNSNNGKAPDTKDKGLDMDSPDLDAVSVRKLRSTHSFRDGWHEMGRKMPPPSGP